MAADMKKTCKDCVHFNPIEYICEETMQPKDGTEETCPKLYSWEQCEKDNDL